jgi:hypothetical protein
LRADSAALIGSKLFESPSMNFLSFLDRIVLKEPRDRFQFFRSLPEAMNGFSERMLRSKIIPVLIEECCAAPKLAPVLICPIIEAAKSFPSNIFTNEVYLRIADLTLFPDPPELLVAFIQKLDTILRMTDPSIHSSKVNPIVMKALSSTDPLVLREILRKLPTVVPLLDETAVKKGVIPRLIKLCECLCDLEYIVGALNCIPPCLEKIDHNMFLKWIVPRFSAILALHQDPIVVQSISELLLALHGDEHAAMAYGVPLAAAITEDSCTDPYYKQQLVSWMLSIVTRYSTLPEIAEAEDPKPPEIEHSHVDIMALFDPLAEQLHLTPADQVFDFTCEPSSGNVVEMCV